jgi:transcriptional regulator with XRE-family HTH domain
MSIAKLRELNNFSDRLIFLRGKRSKAAFAREIGVSAPLYHQWENGAVPTYDKALLIAKTCNVPVDVLLTGNQVMHTKNVSFQSNQKGVIPDSLTVQDDSAEYKAMPDGPCKNCVLLQAELDAVNRQLARQNAVIDDLAEVKEQLARQNAVIDKLVSK